MPQGLLFCCNGEHLHVNNMRHTESDSLVQHVYLGFLVIAARADAAPSYPPRADEEYH